jgi:hypothetical protein
MEAHWTEPRLNFLYLFSAWDTGWYLFVAQNWYPRFLSPPWHFFPLYPSMIRVLVWVGVEPLLGAWIISTIAGLLSISAFQRVAEDYFPRTRASTTTVLYFLFPTVLLFSGVSYTEPLFLLFSLVAWESHKRGSELTAAFMVSLSTLTRLYGIFVAFPLAYDYLRRGEFRKLSFLTFPAISLLAWFLYAYARTGDFFMPLTSFSHFAPADPTVLAIQTSMLQLVTGDLRAVSGLIGYGRTIVEGLAFTAFIVFLAYKSWRIEPALGFYSFASIVGIVGFGFVTSPFSMPRYLSFIFPLGLSIYSRNRWLAIFTAALFIFGSYLAWQAFILDHFM